MRESSLSGNLGSEGERGRVLFVEQARLMVREAIEDARGREVFFRGVMEGGQVREVFVLARGNSSGVPALFQEFDPGDIMIHNHPSGLLEPSDQDLMIAAQAARDGIGSVIVDNRCEGAYVVVEPLRPDRKEAVTPQEVMELLGPKGPLASRFEGFEVRRGQLEMAAMVADALSLDRVAVVEAGTGTGKSFAYLLPAALWAERNRDRVVVATRTINLQEQLMRKDIPALRDLTGLDISAALVKGRGNYVCLRKVELVAAEGSDLVDSRELSALAEIIAWARSTADGSIEDLGRYPPAGVWEAVASDGDTCRWSKCSHFEKCFFTMSRRKAAGARILVANHHLLLADLEIRHATKSYDMAAVLPTYRRIVLDEGHHIEETATSYFGRQVTELGLTRILGKLHRKDSSTIHKGLLPMAARLLGRHEREMLGLVHDLEASLEDLAAHIRDKMGLFLNAALALGRWKLPPRGEELKVRVVPTLEASAEWRDMQGEANELAQRLHSGANRLRQLADKLADMEREDLSQVADEIASQGTRLGQVGADLGVFAEPEAKEAANLCRWFEISHGRKGPYVRLCAHPVDVRPLLRSALLDPFPTVAITSATLTVAGSFDYLSSRIGLEGLDPQRMRKKVVDSPFDFRKQALLAVPLDMPTPDSQGFEQALCQAIPQLIRTVPGGVFVLFTSYGMLRKVLAVTGPQLEGDGRVPMSQGNEARTVLLSRFRRTNRGVLFATDSFWEGVDVPGDALQCVIITRLPFKVPTEPILQARAERIEAEGGNPFYQYHLPQAIIRFRQGFGRLIRTRSDRGVVVILDSRINRKSYGSYFLKSLPPAPVLRGPLGEVVKGMERFFG